MKISKAVERASERLCLLPPLYKTASAANLRWHSYPEVLSTCNDWGDRFVEFVLGIESPNNFLVNKVRSQAWHKEEDTRVSDKVTGMWDALHLTSAAIHREGEEK